MITLDEAQAELGRLRGLADQIRTAEYRTVSLYHRVYDRTNGGGRWKLWRERRASLSRTTGTAPLPMMSASTCPGPKAAGRRRPRGSRPPGAAPP